MYGFWRVLGELDLKKNTPSWGVVKGVVERVGVWGGLGSAASCSHEACSGQECQ